MTGQHQGHTRVRGNAEPARVALKAEDVTVATVLRRSGYRTGLVGKWGLGDVVTAEAGLPGAHGFDEFFGFLNHKHAHNHFPDFLWRNDARVSLPNEVVRVGDTGAGYATRKVAFADDLFAEEALRFVTEERDRPFFLAWCPTIPHVNNERQQHDGDGVDAPDLGPYADRAWPQPDRGHAALITRLDGSVGRLLERLRAGGLAEDTLVVFTSDNGPLAEGRHDTKRFGSSGQLRGSKRSLHDGGIRVPCIAWWPGTILPGRTSDHVAYFGDFMATAAALAGVEPPAGCDSISFLPTLLGDGAGQREHEFLYWEFHEGGFSQAGIWQGRWKGIRSGGPRAPVAVYDLIEDVGETTDVAATNPDVARALAERLDAARTPSADWEPVWRERDGSPR
jgi:arylsulfatase A-like enzyme